MTLCVFTNFGAIGFFMISGVLNRYKHVLPVTHDTPIFTLGEGDTPLVRSRGIAEKVGCVDLYFKVEGCNPTGSFKDRGMVVAVAKAIEKGMTSIACASTGNTSASAAAYGAYCGLRTTLIVPKGKVARGKLNQAVAYGAHIALINGNFDQALQLARELCDKHPIELVNSLNPNRIEGQKTAAFEIIDDLGTAPDELFIPVGNAGNITAYWKGFKEAYENKVAVGTPKMRGIQAIGSDPIVVDQVINEPETIASAIRIGNPASWESAIVSRDESEGSIQSVSDSEILEAYELLASSEGLFCEPASAASVAGLLRRFSEGENFEDKTIVCVLTGNGLKDPDIADGISPVSLEEYDAELESLEKAFAIS